MTVRHPFPSALLDRATCPFDPPAALGELGEEAPVSRIELRTGGHAWLVTDYQEARSVLADTRFSSDTVRRRSAMDPRPAAECPAERQDGMFLFMDPPEHTRLRRLLTGQFTVRRMQALEARIRDIAVEHIEAMRAAGTEADLVPRSRCPAVAGDLRTAGRGLRRPRRVPGAHGDLAEPDQERGRTSAGVEGHLRVHGRAGRGQAPAPRRRPAVRPRPR